MARDKKACLALSALMILTVLSPMLTNQSSGLENTPLDQSWSFFNQIHLPTGGSIDFDHEHGSRLTEGGVEIGLAPSIIGVNETLYWDQNPLKMGNYSGTNLTPLGIEHAETSSPPGAGGGNLTVKSRINLSGEVSFDVLRLTCIGQGQCGIVHANNGLVLRVNTLIVEQGTSITADAKIWNGTSPGEEGRILPPGTESGGGGGGHAGYGGKGGSTAPTTSAPPYGWGDENGSSGGNSTSMTSTHPKQISSLGGRGGGRIAILAAEMILEGGVTANGGNGEMGKAPLGGFGPGEHGAGGGSGGSIHILANNLSIGQNAFITAEGGNGGRGRWASGGASGPQLSGGHGGGGGSGGFVTILTKPGGLQQASLNGIRADAGSGGLRGVGAQGGLDGINGTAGSVGRITIENFSGFSQSPIINGSSYGYLNLSNTLTIWEDLSLRELKLSCTLTSCGKLIIIGKANITAHSIDIAPGSMIWAGSYVLGGVGSGGNGENGTSSSAGRGAGGGGHLGTGGDGGQNGGLPSVAGSSHGIGYEPGDSGGEAPDNTRNSSAMGGVGGGMLRIVAQTIKIGGTVSVGGTPGTDAKHPNASDSPGLPGAGGGSGGSLELIANAITLSNGSHISAAGGAGGAGSDAAFPSNLLGLRPGGHGGGGGGGGFVRLVTVAGQLVQWTSPDVSGGRGGNGGASNGSGIGGGGAVGISGSSGAINISTFVGFPFTPLYTGISSIISPPLSFIEQEHPLEDGFLKVIHSAPHGSQVVVKSRIQIEIGGEWSNWALLENLSGSELPRFRSIQVLVELHSLDGNTTPLFTGLEISGHFWSGITDLSLTPRGYTTPKWSTKWGSGHDPTNNPLELLVQRNATTKNGPLGSPSGAGNGTITISNKVIYSSNITSGTVLIKAGGEIAISIPDFSITANTIIIESGGKITSSGFTTSTSQGGNETRSSNGNGNGAGGAGHAAQGGNGGGVVPNGGSAYGIGFEVGAKGGSCFEQGGTLLSEGGDGGGVIRINAGKIIVNGSLTSEGLDGADGVGGGIGNTESGGHGAGGGSGGSIIIKSNVMEIGQYGFVSAMGGDGGQGGDALPGGHAENGGHGGGGGSGGYISIRTMRNSLLNKGIIIADGAYGGVGGSGTGGGVNGVGGDYGHLGVISTSTSFAGYRSNANVNLEVPMPIDGNSSAGEFRITAVTDQLQSPVIIRLSSEGGFKEIEMDPTIKSIHDVALTGGEIETLLGHGKRTENLTDHLGIKWMNLDISWRMKDGTIAENGTGVHWEAPSLSYHLNTTIAKGEVTTVTKLTTETACGSWELASSSCILSHIWDVSGSWNNASGWIDIQFIDLKWIDDIFPKIDHINLIRDGIETATIEVGDNMSIEVHMSVIDTTLDVDVWWRTNPLNSGLTKVVTLGSSTTAGSGASDPQNTAYVPKIEKWLKENNSKLSISNLGQGGAKVGYYQSKINEIQTLSPDVVTFLPFGDYANTPPAQWWSDYVPLLESIENTGAHILFFDTRIDPMYVCGNGSGPGGCYPADEANEINQKNDIIAAIAANMSNITVIPYVDTNAEHPEWNAPDGHPNDNGHEHIFSEFKEAFVQLLSHDLPPRNGKVDLVWNEAVSAWVGDLIEPTGLVPENAYDSVIGIDIIDKSGNREIDVSYLPIRITPPAPRIDSFEVLGTPATNNGFRHDEPVEITLIEGGKRSDISPFLTLGNATKSGGSFTFKSTEVAGTWNLTIHAGRENIGEWTPIVEIWDPFTNGYHNTPITQNEDILIVDEIAPSVESVVGGWLNKYERQYEVASAWSAEDGERVDVELHVQSGYEVLNRAYMNGTLNRSMHNVLDLSKFQEGNYSLKLVVTDPAGNFATGPNPAETISILSKPKLVMNATITISDQTKNNTSVLVEINATCDSKCPYGIEIERNNIAPLDTLVTMENLTNGLHQFVLSFSEEGLVNLSIYMRAEGAETIVLEKNIYIELKNNISKENQTSTPVDDVKDHSKIDESSSSDRSSDVLSNGSSLGIIKFLFILPIIGVIVGIASVLSSRKSEPEKELFSSSSEWGLGQQIKNPEGVQTVEWNELPAGGSYVTDTDGNMWYKVELTGEQWLRDESGKFLLKK